MVNFFYVLVLGFLLSSTSHAVVQTSSVPSMALGATPSQPNGTAILQPSCLGASGSNKCFTVFATSHVTAGSGTCYAFKRNNKTTGAFEAWAVSAGTVAHCFAIAGQSTLSGQVVQFMYGTASFSDNATCSGITGVQYQGGASGGYMYTTGVTASVLVPLPGTIEFPASSSPGFQQGVNNSTYLTMTCYEQ